jgi:uncharacterized protein YndB with AHSA1/START domain
MLSATRLMVIVGLGGVLTAGAAWAEVVQASADAFTVRHARQVPVPPAQVYASIGQVGKWWVASHTWSKSSANLSLDLRPGGCFCERWGEAGVEHGRVVMVMPNQIVRLAASLGPLQEMAVTGALTFELQPNDGGTQVTVTYRVSGTPEHKFDAFAAMVDGVIGEQATALAAFVGR